MVAFCSLAGDVFPKPPTAPTAGAPDNVPAAPVQVSYVAQMLRLVLPWVTPAQQALQQALAGDEGQLIDACRALSALCSGHKPGVLAAASAAALSQHQQPQHAASIFTTLEELSTCFLAAGGVSGTSSPEVWLYEGTEMLLECWSGLLAPQCGYNMVSVPPPQQAVESAGRTAAVLVEAALADAAAGALEVGGVGVLRSPPVGQKGHCHSCQLAVAGPYNPWVMFQAGQAVPCAEYGRPCWLR